MTQTDKRPVLIVREDFAARSQRIADSFFTTPRRVAEGPEVPYKGLVIDGVPVVGDATTHLGLLALYAHRGLETIDEDALLKAARSRDLSRTFRITAACDLRADGSVIQWSSDGLRLDTPEEDRPGLATRFAAAVAEIDRRRALLRNADVNVREGADPFPIAVYATGNLMSQLNKDNAAEVFGERKSLRFLLLQDGTFLYGRFAYHCYLLHAFDSAGRDDYDAAVTEAYGQADYEQAHAHRVLACGEVSLEGEVLSWSSTGFGIETPRSFRDHILRTIPSAIELLRLIPGEMPPRPVLTYLSSRVIPRLSTATATAIYKKLKADYKFLVLRDGTVLLGDQRWHRYLLALHDHWNEADPDFEASVSEVEFTIEQFDAEHTHRIAAAGEASKDGTITSWTSTGFQVETPEPDRAWIAEAITHAISRIPPVIAE